MSDSNIVPVSSKEDNVTFFKKRSTNKNIRKRKTPIKVKSDSDGDDSEEDEVVSEVVTKERKTGLNPFVQSTRKRRNKKTGGDSDEDDEDDAFGTLYKADHSAQVKKSDAARYDTEWELQKQEMEKHSKPEAKKNTVNSKMSVGPQRAPANLRVTARFDYQADICKDYKETGFCGYGDSCIFLHDRGDYKTGWQLEKEWEEATKNKTTFGATDPNKYAISEEDDSDEELPFACLLCREEFVAPVVTKCNHYFCEACAIKNYKKSSKCFACGAPTHGVFNTAKKLLEKLEEKKKRINEADGSDQESRPVDGFIEGLAEESDDE